MSSDIWDFEELPKRNRCVRIIMNSAESNERRFEAVQQLSSFGYKARALLGELVSETSLPKWLRKVAEDAEIRVYKNENLRQLGIRRKIPRRRYSPDVVTPDSEVA